MLICSAIAPDYPRQQEIVIDESIFFRIASGEKEAFCALYQQTRSAIFTYALSLLRNQADAEDAMQDTYLKIRSAAHLYRSEGKPMAWIFTITRNVCLMKLRKQQRFAAFPTDDELPDFQQIEDAEDRMVLKTAFKILSQEECRIIFLHAVTGLKHRQISELLGLPLSTVLSKYNRGLKKLKSELEGSL